MIKEQKGHGLSEAVRDLRRAAELLPTPKMVKELDRVLGAAFADTQEKTHTVTGALKASGRHGSNNRPGDSWLGRIAYGGTPGTQHAIYEMAEGGEHDFLRDLPLFDAAYEQVIENGVREALR